MVYVIERLAARVQAEGLKVVCVPTSFQSRGLLLKHGLTVGTLDDYPAIDVTIDGADEVDANLALIKGGGACQTQEKVVAANSKTLVIVADYRKDSARLGDQVHAGRNKGGKPGGNEDGKGRKPGRNEGGMGWKPGRNDRGKDRKPSGNEGGKPSPGRRQARTRAGSQAREAKPERGLTFEKPFPVFTPPPPSSCPTPTPTVAPLVEEGRAGGGDAVRACAGDASSACAGRQPRPAHGHRRDEGGPRGDRQRQLCPGRHVPVH